MKKLIPLLIALLISSLSIAQLAVTNAAPFNSPAYLVNNILLGTGISTSNITYTGDANQIGYFSNGLAGAVNPLGLNDGLVFSTGNVNDIPSAGNLLSTSFFNPGDSDLLTIAQSVRPGISSTHDAATLEFDFIPEGDTVELRFVFSSEEYKTFINTNFNDIFSIFLSGPGFSGPYASPAGFPNGAENLAVVPGTSTPITISTIYNDPTKTPPSVNGQFYIDNPVENTFSLNGYTTVMAVKFYVTCNSSYHFKFAIADCQDGSFDTGVFMEASSFSSNAPIGIQFSTASAGANSTIIEGCENATLNLTRNDTIGNHTLHFTIGGTATNGVDYSLIADSVTFLSGIDTASITIIPLTDAFIEGQESITITTISINTCGNTVVSSDSMYINDMTSLAPITALPDTVICINGTATLSTTASGASFPISLIWDNGLLGNGPHQVNPTANTTTYTVYAQDANGCISDTSTIDIQLYPPIIINEISLTDSTICEGTTSIILVNAIGGGTSLVYTWYDGNNNIIGVTDTGAFIITPTFDGEVFSVIVTDSCTTPTKTENISIVVEICTGINETLSDFGLTIYPNPSNGEFTIEKPIDLNETVHIKILDVTSRLILETTIDKESQNKRIDISKYDSGIYYIQLIINDQVSVKRILKE